MSLIIVKNAETLTLTITLRGTAQGIKSALNIPPLKKILSDIRHFKQRLNSRRALLRLTQEQLNDIGISKVQAISEAKIVFWK